jgi:hypothetical protein
MVTILWCSPASALDAAAASGSGANGGGGDGGGATDGAGPGAGSRSIATAVEVIGLSNAGASVILMLKGSKGGTPQSRSSCAVAGTGTTVLSAGDSRS